jgi:hypothetical protein
MNSTSIYTADRMTHLKIVAVSLICATVVTGISVAAHVTDETTTGSRLETNVIRAGAPVAAANNDIMIR